MPMDHDDNDTSHHNLQLGGEGRARSSSALRPYDFPKFDFSDSLQGHLRYDSLVETEVFLGIQSQEDNQWIEDFSRGSNGMEFNSTPADSCSISLRNNVWSEATSSESVEMLLKSVGQEDMKPGASIVPESDATADQDTFIKIVESSNNNTQINDRNNSIAANSDTNEVLEGHPASSKHVEEQLENPLASHTKDESLCGNSCNFSPISSCGNGGTLLIEDKHSHHAELTSEVAEELKSSVSKTLGDRDSLSFPSITDNVDSDSGMLSTSKACQQVKFNVSHESCISDGQEKHISSKTALEDSATLQGKEGVTSIHTRFEGSSFGLVPDSGRDSQETNLDSGRESVDNLVKEEFVLKSSEGDDTNTSFTTSIQTVRPENALSLSNEMVKPFDKCQGGSPVDGIVQHSIELGSISSGQCVSPMQMTEPTMQLPCERDNDNVEDVSASPLKYESVSERSLRLIEVNDAPTTLGEGIDKVVLSSAADQGHLENSLGCPQDTIATEDDSGVHLLADDMNVSMRVIQEKLDQSQVDVLEREKDTGKTTVADKVVPGDLENVDSENIGMLEKDHKTQSLEVSEGNDGDTFIHNLQPQTSGKQESGDYPEVGQRETAAIGLLHPDNGQEEVGMSVANLKDEVDNASKVEVSKADDTVQIPICEISAMAQQHVEKTDDISSCVLSSMEQLNKGCNKSSLEENADFLGGGETMTKELEKESGQTADIDKTSCGSPTIISSSEPSQIESDIQEGRGNQVTNEVKDIQSISEDLKRIDPLGDDSGFTFKVNALPDTIDREPGKNWSPFPDVDKSKVLEETAPSSKSKTKTKTERKSSPKTPRQNSKVFDGETGPGTSKGTSERKGRRGSAKGTTKENVKKGNQSKGPTLENAEKVSNSLLSPPCSSPHVKFDQMQQHSGNVEARNKKPSSAVAVAMSNLPDLNSTTSSSPPFRQPFSDLQQVQLRAQIFVYGSLIQGNVPDEACMVSAFGQHEGGRSFWEQTWRTAAERVQNQKSKTATETPHSQSGARASDAVKQGSISSKIPATPVSRANIKETPAAVSSPSIPLSSPLWNISTPQNSLISNPMHKGPVVDFQHALTPVHSYQTSPIRTFVGHTSWPSQTGFPGSWLASPQTSSFNSNAQFRPVTMTETVKLTPIKDTSSILSSSGKHTTSSPAAHTVSPSPALGVSPHNDPKSIASSAQISVDAKPRKRKKVPTSDPGQVTFVSEAQAGEKVILNVTSLPTIPVNASTPASLTSDAILSNPTADASTVSPIGLPRKSDLDTVKGITCSEEMLTKVAEAKSQAEDAAALADAAVTHGEDLWCQLAKHKDSGLTSASEAKLASSAAAIAAAASVAKAAAAAAKIACNAALLAKLMADEAVHSSKNCDVTPSSGMYNAGNTTPSSNLRVNSVTNQSSSILVAAKEAAKRRVEAASAASRQAENLDAIVKAAELAAAAVSQAGKIVAMGEPLPLNDLIEGGPEGYWKLSQPSVVLAGNLRARNVDPSVAVTSDKTCGIPACIPPSDSAEKGGSGIAGKDDVRLKEGPDGLSNACSSIFVEGSNHKDEKDFRNGMDLETCDNSKSSRAASEIDTLLRTTNIKNDSDDMAAQVVDGIKEGSFVEVFNPRSVQKSAWYTANVLSVEKGKAYVLYNDLLSEEGSRNVREWVPLESEGDKAPIIRVAHSLQHQKTRKRRRAALADYVWSVGDRVDVWIDDSWWEGVVTEKNEKDETTLKVHISVQGDTSTVRAWNLRASRSWINGKWIEWSSSKRQNASEQCDTPQEKRKKLGSRIVSNLEDKEPNTLDSTLGKPKQSKTLTLSTSERTFDIGKTTASYDNKQAARRPLRTNQQKEGSRVVFGVPKPTGKKRKFMEVSKHFSANKTDKSNETNNSVKFAKYLMPQGAPSRGWKAPTRNDTKEKRIVEPKPRVLSSRNAQRTLPQRENSRSKLAQDDTPIHQGTDVEDSVSQDENTSDKSMDHGSTAFEDAAEAPLSSLLPHYLSTTSKKSSSNSKTNRLKRGRLGPSGGKLSKIEEEKVFSANTGKSTLDASEPRRSNRRIQPTHRLLEGLQSSMAIPKMPAVSHDKSRRNLPARGK